MFDALFHSPLSSSLSFAFVVVFPSFCSFPLSIIWILKIYRFWHGMMLNVRMPCTSTYKKLIYHSRDHHHHLALLEWELQTHNTQVRLWHTCAHFSMYSFVHFRARARAFLCVRACDFGCYFLFSNNIITTVITFAFSCMCVESLWLSFWTKL